MLIKLTNANPALNGNLIVINSEHIVTMFEETVLKGTAGEHTVTNVYVPPHGTWQVLENLELICTILTEDPYKHLSTRHRAYEIPGTEFNPTNANTSKFKPKLKALMKEVNKNTSVEVVEGQVSDEDLTAILATGIPSIDER